MIGRLISGRYRIEAVVGTGGMAVVYRALDTQENRIVAIKVLRPEYESDMEFVRRFSREAEAAAKMSHENIVNLLDVGIEGEMRYIVMEYVDGQTLKEMIREEGRIGIPAFVREDGTVTLDENEALAWIGQPPVEEQDSGCATCK